MRAEQAACISRVWCLATASRSFPTRSVTAEALPPEPKASVTATQRAGMACRPPEALQCLCGGWQGRFDYELQALFATLQRSLIAVLTNCPILLVSGRPSISNGMNDAGKRRARGLLVAASREAINHVRQGNDRMSACQANGSWRQS